VFTNLASGPYVYSVKDAHNCTKSGSFIIPALSDISCSISVSILNSIPGQAANTIFLGYGSQSATLTATANNGTGSYTFNWGNAGTGNPITVSPVVSTTYTVVITDQNGCHSTCSVTINVTDIRCANKKVLVCHKAGNSWNTLCISTNAVSAHLAHGDYLGSCNSSITSRAETTSAIDTRKEGEHLVGISAYPNPSSRHFTIKIETTSTIDKINLQVMDVNGTEIEQRNNLNPGQLILLGTNYKPGIYVAEIVQGSERKVLKLLKFEE
jgi:hypothetical protein